jgi:glucan endo-1,3-alpha-glucosidase
VQDGWQYNFKDVLSAQGIDVYFVPSFSDSNIAPTEIFSTFPVADGFFSWDTAWPWASEGKVNVDSTLDMEYHLTAASLGQTYMMRSF